jgi:hypothetical protein
VIVDGRLIFSKSQSGRFPVDDEVEEIFEAIKNGKEPPAAKEAEERPGGFIRRVLDKLTN